MTRIAFSRTAALIVGMLLPVIETWRRWNMLAQWPRWLHDYIAAALLIYAWHAGRDTTELSRPYLMAAWGYTAGMAYMSFFGFIESAPVTDPSGVPVAGVLTFKAFGLMLSALCLALAWPKSRRRSATAD